MTMSLHTEHVTRCFKTLKALNDVSFDVEAGERVALLGHNGAGKTTLFRIILGFLPANEGLISIHGHAPGSKEARNCISYLPESVAFPKVLTGREIITLYAKLKGAGKTEIMSVLEKVGLEDAADRRCGTYSKGMRQRLGLAQAFIGTPKLLLLDEPTSGLDPLSRQQFYHLISEIAANGAAVLLSSHGLSELEAKTDRVAILRNGTLVANAPLEDLQRVANLPIRIRVRAGADSIESLHNRLGGDRINGASVEFQCGQKDKMERLSVISDLGPMIEDIDIAPPSLDDVYRYFSNPDTQIGTLK